jgi:putative heme-binding domain-containing protein
MIAPQSYRDKHGGQEEVGDIRFVDVPGMAPLGVHDRNLRFRPDTHELEALAGYSQFGHAFDDWGRHFATDNAIHIRQEAIRAEYAKRNQDLPMPSAMEDLSDHGNSTDVFPITIKPELASVTGFGKSTSTCGITIVQSGAFRGNLYGSSLVAEPVHNVVHRDILAPSGSTFKAKRAQEKQEFLASTDAWFRPVDLYIGPDGAIYLADFYRPVLEHPEWIPAYSAHSKDVYRGNDRGRIYRIVPDRGLPVSHPRLSSASTAELVRYLDSDNVWWRRTAQRLLVDRKPADAVSELRAFYESASALGKLHVLWTLQGLGALDAGLIERALTAREAGLRENAIRLAESHVTSEPRLARKMLAMVQDPDARVRFQLLCTLGTLRSVESRAARERLLFGDIDDKWMQVAALSASSTEAARLFETATQITASQSEGRANLLRQIAAIIGRRGKSAEVAQVLRAVQVKPEAASAWWRAAMLDGLALGMQAGQTMGSEVVHLVLPLVDAAEPAIRLSALQILASTGLPVTSKTKAAVDRAAKLAVDESGDPQRRADGVSLLILAGPQRHQDLLASLIRRDEPELVKAAAVRGIAKLEGSRPAEFLLQHWKSFPPAARREAGDGLVADPARMKLFFSAIRDGRVQMWMLTPRQRYRLMDSPDAAVRDEARATLRFPVGARAEVLKRYQQAVSMKTDVEQGKRVFSDICAKCHKLDGKGAEVGPDLATVRNRGKGELLSDILLPNETIASGYESYVVELASGAVLDGVLGNKSPTSITLRHEQGKEDVIQRKDIKSMYATDLSAMPEDLDKQISVQQMADVLEYLKSAH